GASASWRWFAPSAGGLEWALCVRRRTFLRSKLMLIRPAARVIRLVRLAKATKRLRFNEPLNHCEEYKMREWLTDFRQTIESATECLLRFDEAESARPQAEGKWSAKEVMGHLIASAANNHACVVLAQRRDDLVFPGYEQNRWVEVQHYREASWPQLV